MNRAALPLGQLSRGELEWLRKGIARRQIATPLSAAALAAAGKPALAAKLGALAGAGQDAAMAMIDLALAVEDGGGAGGPATAAATLVWSGPAVTPSSARATTAMVLELLGSATTEVLIVGYRFDHGKVIFAPLHKAMVERGVKVALALDVAPVGTGKLDAHLAVAAHQFVSGNWPFGPPYPTLRYWRAGCTGDAFRSLHAKCVVVDRARVLIGSANFTRRGYERNLEMGVAVDDPALAAGVVQQFEALVSLGELPTIPFAAVAPAPPVAAEDDDDARGLAAPAVTAGGASPVHAARADALMVDAAARPLFAQLLDAGLPEPEVGADLEGEGGEVLGSPELAWPAAQVAVLSAAQEAARARLEAAGWSCFPVAVEGPALAALIERVRGAE
jgi:hypothetical protein